MAPAPDQLSAPGAATYDSNTMVVGDGTWDFSKNSFLLPNLQGTNFDTMRYNGMGNRFSTLDQYQTIILAHGILAAIVFLLLVPASVMLARFYSREPGYAVRYHAQLHVFACLLLLAAFILPFFAVGPSRSLTNPHHGIGVAIFVLFVVQLFGGRLVRSITKIRSLRVVLHQWLGRATALLGIIQIPLGLALYGSPKYLFILYAVWMGFLLVAYFVLSYQSEGRREMYMAGDRSEAGRTRITESEYFSEHREDHGARWKWLGPLAAGVGLLALMRGRKKDQDDTRSRPRSRSRSLSRSRGPTVLSSRRGSASYFNEKYSDLPPQRGGGGFMRALGGVAAGLGAGKLFSNMMNRRDRRDEEYSAVSTETPRRNRSGRATTISEFNSEYTDDLSTVPPSQNPAATAQTMSRGARRPASPQPSRARDNPRRDQYDDSEYSSYVSPSRRVPDDDARGGGFAKGIMSGLGLGWLAKKLADKRAKKEDDREDDGRSGTQISRYTGDGYPSPTRRNSHRPAARRSTGRGAETALSELTELTESTIDTRPIDRVAPPPPRTPTNGPPAPSALLPDGTREDPRSRREERVSMPCMPSDSHGVLHPQVEGSLLSDATSRPQRQDSSRRRKDGERAAAAAAARASSLAAEERDRFGNPKSPPVSVKLRVHDDKDRNVTLRRLTDEEAMATRGREDSDSSLSAIDSPTQGRRYRRDSSQRRAEAAAEHRVEEPQPGLLSPPNPAFSKGNRRAKDSAYFSGQPGPSGSVPLPTQTASSVGSHGTWSGMSIAPSGPPDRERDKDKGNESVAADNRRRRRLERRRGSSSRPPGSNMYD